MPDPRVRKAVDASLAWYDALCTLHGVRCGIEDDTWVAYDPPPPLHSTAKTVEPGTAPDRALAAVASSEQGGVADSFGELELRGAGLDLLFEAQWIHRPATDPLTRHLPSGWSVVRTSEALARWTARPDTSDVLLPGLLDRSSFRVLGRYADGRPVAGAVTHLCGGVVDLSNVWAEDGDEPDWPELVRVVSALHPGRDIVGWEHGEALDRARDAGFAAVGPQLVWAR